MLSYEERKNLLEQKQILQQNMKEVHGLFESIKDDPLDFNRLFETIAAIAQTLENTVISYTELVDAVVEHSRNSDGDQK